MNFTTSAKPFGYVTTSPLSFSIQALVFAALICTILSKRSSKPSKIQKAQRQLPPGPLPWPVIGSAHEIVKNRPTYRWIHRVMKDLKTDIACFRFGSVHVVSVACDVIAREVLREKDAVFAQRPYSYSYNILTGNQKTTIFTHYGEQWKKMRKILVTELNSSATLNWLHDKRIQEADHLVAYVNKLYEQSKIVNVRTITQHYCHSVSLRIMFGNRYLGEATPDGGPSPADIEHTEAVFQTLEYISAFFISDYIPCLRGLGVDEIEKLFKAGTDTMDKYEVPIVEERIEMWRKKGGKKKVEDWLDILITLKDDDGTPLLTPAEIQSQIREITAAAIDNPANNVEWVIAEMLNQPETFKKAVDELDRVVGKGRLVQESDIPDLNYIKACCREGYRLHPIAPFVVPHVAREDTTLGGYFIPKDTHVLVSRIALGRNPKIWEEPDLFKPERHLGVNRGLGGCGSTEVVLAEPDMRFVSFSTGRRGCIAVKLGSYMNVVLLARLLQGFTWSLPGTDWPVSGRVDLREAPGLLMAKPLFACVEPRLAPNLYPKIDN